MMTELDMVIRSIPIRHDIFSYVMFSGVILGAVLVLSILSRWKSTTHSTKILCAVVLCMILVLADLGLSYTGHLKYYPHLIDTTEFLVILVIPLVYFLVQSINTRRPFLWRKDWIHLILPILYLLSECFFFVQPAEIKINALIDAFHPELQRIDFDPTIPVDPTGLRGLHRELIFISALSYVILIFCVNFKTVKFREIKSVFHLKSRKLIFVRNTLILTIGFFLFVLYIFSSYDHDLGDHLIGIFISYLIFAAAYFVINESRLFEASWIADKYETSGLGEDHSELLGQVRAYMDTHRPYLDAGFNLKHLAAEMQVSANYISQSVNTSLSINFSEFVNQYRISESQLRLKDESYAHLSIEGIGQSVGFRSKSSFYTSFKKQKGMTPKAFQTS